MASERSLAHNWLLLALVSLVSFGGAVLYLLVGNQNSPVFLIYFVVAASLIAGVAFWWFGKHPPRMAAPGWMYLGVVLTLIVGGTFLSMIPGTRAVASWLTLAVCFALYGFLERSTVIVSAGLITCAATVAVYLAGPAQLGLILETVTGGVFAVAAVIIARAGRRAPPR